MHIEINSIRKEKDSISPSDFALPHRENFISILESSLLKNPLLESLKDKINMVDLKLIKIKINVIAEGNCLYLPRGTDFADIDFVDYFDNKNKPALLRLHFGMYMGLRVFPLKKLFGKAKMPGNNSQIRKELSEQGLDTKGLQKTLFHEFGHLIDALDPEFGYSNEIYCGVAQEESLHSIFENLWNCYLDRRLQNALGWGPPYAYGCSYVRGAEESAWAIWKSSKVYNFKELIDHSLQVQQKNQKLAVDI
ncbi:MAG: hypothetical protein ACYSR0_00850 [Planctomycetota bacterium]|jgi:hypothetical protein